MRNGIWNRCLSSIQFLRYILKILSLLFLAISRKWLLGLEHINKVNLNSLKNFKNPGSTGNVIATGTLCKIQLEVDKFN